MEYLIAVIAALLGLLFYKNSKLSSAEGLLSNQKEKEELLKSREDDAVLKAKDQVESDKRREITDRIKAEVGREPTKDELEGFFNRPSNHD